MKMLQSSDKRRKTLIDALRGLVVNMIPVTMVLDWSRSIGSNVICRLGDKVKYLNVQKSTEYKKYIMAKL